MKTTPQPYYLGVDICKAKLDVHCRAWPSTRSFTNDARGIASLLKAAARLGAVHLVAEATGGYEKRLMEAAFAAGVTLSLTNPRQVRDFAKARGTHAKTDPIDAAVLTHYGECFQPRPSLPQSPQHKALQACVRRRANLVLQRQRERIALEKTDDAFVRQDIRSLLRVLDARIKKAEKHIASLIADDADMKAKALRMEQVAGVGRVVSSTVLAELPELGKISDKQAASLVGLAPFNADSGKRGGQRRTKGGRELVRRTLYMPALSSCFRNPVFKHIYQRLIHKGKPHHVAIVAVMRKLVCLLNRLLADPSFQPPKVKPASCRCSHSKPARCRSHTLASRIGWGHGDCAP